MDTPATPTTPNTTGQRELNATEMMFLVSAYFYIEASILAQQALEAKNPAFVVVKKETDSTIQDDIKKTEQERTKLKSEHPESFDEDSKPSPVDATDKTGRPIKPTA